jgi:hypothetical protein
MVPLLFTSITKESHQVLGASPAYAFLYNEIVLDSISETCKNRSKVASPLPLSNREGCLCAGLIYKSTEGLIKK